MNKLDKMLLNLSKCANDKLNNEYKDLVFGDINGLLSPTEDVSSIEYNPAQFTIFLDTSVLKRNSFYNDRGFKIGNTYTLNYGILSKRIDENELNLIENRKSLTYNVVSFYLDKLTELTDTIQCWFYLAKRDGEIRREIIKLSFDDFEIDYSIFEIHNWIYCKCTLEITLIK